MAKDSSICPITDTKHVINRLGQCIYCNQYLQDIVEVRGEYFGIPRTFNFKGSPELGTPDQLEDTQTGHISPEMAEESVRIFETGATRDTDEGKNDYEGFFSPLVIEAFGDYMNRHRIQSDGNVRDSDNWQKGMPKNAYIKSWWRHFLDIWKEHRGYKSRDGMKEALCAALFNNMGYLHEFLKEELKKRDGE